jgi:hypothetical protein
MMALPETPGEPHFLITSENDARPSAAADGKEVVLF